MSNNKLILFLSTTILILATGCSEDVKSVAYYESLGKDKFMEEWQKKCSHYDMDKVRKNPKKELSEDCFNMRTAAQNMWFKREW